MKTINVVDVLKNTALVTAEDGESLFSIIVKKLMTQSELALDFNGYEYISSVFLNRSFGKLSVEKKWNFKEMIEHIKIFNLSNDDMEDVELAVVNANERAKLMKKGVDLNKHYSSIYNY